MYGPVRTVLVCHEHKSYEREGVEAVRNCISDGGRPSEVGLQEQISNCRKLRW